MNKTRIAYRVFIALTACVLLLSCNPLENKSQSANMLIIDRIQGTDLEGNRADMLYSDVLFVDPNTSTESIHADFAWVTFRARTLEPSPDTGTSQYNDILVTRYVVTFSLPDGSSREGQDVPYSFEGSLSALIRSGSSREVSFVMVREVAKLEPPLVDLVDGDDVLEVIATIDFYGHDLADKDVHARGYLTIFFANYINKQSSAGEDGDGGSTAMKNNFHTGSQSFPPTGHRH